MRMFDKIVVSATALAFASSLAFVSAQALTMAGKPTVSTQIVKVADEKKDEKKAKPKAKAKAKPKAKAVKAKAKAKVKASKKAGPGHCGVAKYWDKKTHKCADATTKK